VKKQNQRHQKVEEEEGHLKTFKKRKLNHQKIYNLHLGGCEAEDTTLINLIEVEEGVVDLHNKEVSDFMHLIKTKIIIKSKNLIIKKNLTIIKMSNRRNLRRISKEKKKEKKMMMIMDAIIGTNLQLITELRTSKAIKKNNFLRLPLPQEMVLIGFMLIVMVLLKQEWQMLINKELNK